MSLNCSYIYHFPNPACWFKAAVPKTNSTGLLFTTIGIGVTAIIWLGLSDLGFTLEPPTQQLAQTSPSSQNQVSVKVIFVNPTVADGNNGDGSESAPFKTITQALQVAEANSVITLAAGTYSKDSGETFPLKLKPGVSIQGNPKTRGSNIAIEGGGTFISPTFARQDITILGANQASLIGVTITNPNPRGYGLWVESSSPTVSDNTFTRSDHDGISVTGKSAPIIRSNYFHHNGANGITIYGTSQAEVRENVFEQTGFGINIAQKATPLVIGNRIVKNRSGVVSQAYAKPVLRNNVIEGNTEDGVVAIAFSQPDLGTKEQPGGNQFRQNGRSDINSSAAKQAIVAVGNQLAQERLIGNIDLGGTGSLTIATANQPPINRQIALNPESIEKKKQQLETAAVNSVQSSPSASQPPADPQSGNRGVQNPASTALAPIDISVPPPESTAQIKPKPSDSPQKQKLSFVQITELKPNQIKIPAADNQPRAVKVPTLQPDRVKVPATGNTKPPAAKVPILPSVGKPVAPPPKNGSFTQGLPVLAPAPINTAELLPVPNANIPMGNNRNQVQQPVIARNPLVPSTGSPPQPPTSLATAIGLRYRVVVEAGNENTQAKVRSLIPGAFRIFARGRVFMQAGAYSDRAKADEVLQLLTGNGLKAQVEEIN